MVSPKEGEYRYHWVRYTSRLFKFDRVKFLESGNLKMNFLSGFPCKGVIYGTLKTPGAVHSISSKPSEITIELYTG